MAKNLNIQAEEVFREVVDEIVDEKYDTTPTAVARELIKLGVDLKKAGEDLEVQGPGGPRPFAKIDFGDEKRSIGTLLSEEVADEVIREFGDEDDDVGLHPAAREALRLGVAAVRSEELTIEGPLGFPRPFAYVDPPSAEDLDDEEAVERLKWLKDDSEGVRKSAVVKGKITEDGMVDIEDLPDEEFEEGDKVQVLLSKAS